jgi:hypothetical protein
LIDGQVIEQRLYRILREAARFLEDMKTKRIAARQADLDAARELHNLNKMKGVPYEQASAGFVFASEEIEAESRRHRRLLEAKIAHDCHYDSEKFHQLLQSINLTP